MSLLYESIRSYITHGKYVYLLGTQSAHLLPTCFNWSIWSYTSFAHMYTCSLHWISLPLSYSIILAHRILIYSVIQFILLSWNVYSSLSWICPHASLVPMFMYSFHLISFIKCLAIISPYRVLVSLLGELNVFTWCVLLFELSKCLLCHISS